jgi:hypothetical protein
MENILPLTTEPTIGGFFRRTARLFADPARFYRDDFPRMTGTTAVAFGVTNAWLGSTLAFFVHTLNSLFLLHLFDRWAQRLLLADDAGIWGLNGNAFLWSAGTVILSPFFFSLGILLSSVMVFLFANSLVADKNSGPDSLTFGNVLRIQGIAYAGRWFRLVPVFGGLLSFIATLILLVTGMRERFAISNRRAVAIVLAPYVLFFFAALAILGIMVFVFSQLPLQELFDSGPRDFGF